MSWEAGNQRRVKKDYKINELLLEKEGFLEEREAKILLYEFLRENTTFATNLLAGIDLFPFQHMAVKSMFESDYFLGIWSRGMSKSWTTGVFAIMDAIMNQGVEIGILSKSFRQAKMIFKKIEDIAAKPEAEYLSQCITKVSKANDEWVMQIGTSSIRALPLGDGSKLRGFRFHRIIIDEMLLMPERIYNEVIVPFLSVVQNPKERETLYDLETKLIESGDMKEEERHIWPNNKLIMLSSASYKFEYLYKLYENFEHLINSGGGDSKTTNASRSIMHFSYDCAPKQLYDQNLIEQAKSTMSQSQYDREFGAVFTDDSSGYFKISKMRDCSIEDGMSPCVEVKGDPKDKYILSFDPSWAESESSDDFAMQVIKLNDEKSQGTLVHVYAMAGARLRDHINYFHYLLTNFNIVCVVGDYNGGVQFFNAVKESSKFKSSDIKLNLIETEFDNLDDYQKSLRLAKKEFSGDGIPCCLRKPTSGWIRRANELLQASFDHKRIWFASRAIDDNYQSQRKKKIPIGELKFLSVGEEDNQSEGAKMIDFVEHQYEMMDYTKGQCALIEVKTSPQGTQTFDLPLTLKRTTGPGKARKDCYSALILGNWMIKIYYDITNFKQEQVNSFVPMFIK